MASLANINRQLKRVSSAAPSRGGHWEQGGARHVPPSGTALPSVLGFGVVLTFWGVRRLPAQLVGA
jgi:hypothetical protein